MRRGGTEPGTVDAAVFCLGARGRPGARPGCAHCADAGPASAGDRSTQSGNEGDRDPARRMGRAHRQNDEAGSPQRSGRTQGALYAAWGDTRGFRDIVTRTAGRVGTFSINPALLHLLRPKITPPYPLTGVSIRC